MVRFSAPTSARGTKAHVRPVVRAVSACGACAEGADVREHSSTLPFGSSSPRSCHLGDFFFDESSRDIQGASPHVHALNRIIDRREERARKGTAAQAMTETEREGEIKQHRRLGRNRSQRATRRRDAGHAALEELGDSDLDLDDLRGIGRRQG